MLKLRILTALILIPFVLAVLFFSTSAVFCIFAGAVFLAAGVEWTNLMQLRTIFSRLVYILMLTFMMLGALFVPVKLILMLSVIYWFLTIPLIIAYPRATILWANKIMKGIMGIMVILPAWVALCVIYDQKDGVYRVLFLFLLIWTADSAAYFVGKKFGVHKLAPNVSPGKSIEGFIGGTIFSLLLASVLFYFADVDPKLWLAGFMLSLITIFFSLIGDLFESMLKREVNLKDSGNLLPGHGGVLDRIDSLTAAAPIFASGAFLIGHLYH